MSSCQNVDFLFHAIDSAAINGQLALSPGRHFSEMFHVIHCSDPGVPRFSHKSVRDRAFYGHTEFKSKSLRNITDRIVTSLPTDLARQIQRC